MEVLKIIKITLNFKMKQMMKIIQTRRKLSKNQQYTNVHLLANSIYL